MGGGNHGIPKIVRRILATPWIKIVDPCHILGRIVNPRPTLIVMEDHPRSSGGAPGWSDNLKNCRSFSFRKLVGPAIPVQWPSATELVHSRMCSKKLTLASWTGLHGHHSGRRHYDGQRGSDTGHDLGLSISPPTSGLGALSPTLSSVGGCPCVCAGSPHCECAG